MPQEPEIIKQEVIVVDTVEEVDNYGKLKFTNKEGNSYSISKKRAHLFPVIQEGRAVELSWANYMKQDYIAEAKLVDLPPEPAPALKKVIIPDVILKKPVTSPTETPKVDEKPPGQQVGMTTKEIGDMIRAGKMKVIFGVEAAVELTKWYRSQILGTTRVTFDGTKLPKFTAENT